MDTNTTDDHDTNVKGSKDFQGKGVKFARAVAQDGVSQRNMKTLSPKAGVWDSEPMFGQDGSKKTQGQEEQEQEETVSGDKEKMKESVSFDISDFVEKLFEGQNLSEDFKEKARVIFESALNQKVEIIENAILEASQEVIAEQVAQNVAIITEKVDDYLSVVVKEWLTENKLAVEQGFRTEIAENFISGLKELFENSYVQVPEEKVDLVDELFAENRELEEKLNTLIQEKMDLEQKNLVNECATVFVELSGDLADTEVEKLANLSEGIEFSDVETYRNKLSVLKESYFNKKSGTTEQMITEDTSITGDTNQPKVIREDMTAYVKTLQSHLKKTNLKF